MVHQSVKTNVIFEDSCLAVMHVIIKKTQRITFSITLQSSPPPDRLSHHSKLTTKAISQLPSLQQ